MANVPMAYFNSNNGSSILGFGDGARLRATANNCLDSIQAFIDEHQGLYIFTALSYDLKNEVEALSSNNPDVHEFPKAIFWVPECVVRLQDDRIAFVQGEDSTDNRAVVEEFLERQQHSGEAGLNVQMNARTSKKEYLKHVEALQEEIQQGSIYEVNYCQEFYAENVHVDDPTRVYFALNNLTKAPYSSYFSFDEFHVFCGSPERYLRKQGNRLTSSPIKGTHKRGLSPEEDEHFKAALLADQKERSENVMIVDLVRNDLSRIASKNSVQVDELFGIYTFETVHQMISTISCTLRPEISFRDILQATFPMGSMTGAPKISAMQLIEAHEDFARGLYSGSIGFIDPNGDFDLNVIIRTLIYNANKQYLSCPVGGAITINSIPEKEYEECKVKIKRILDQLYAPA